MTTNIADIQAHLQIPFHKLTGTNRKVTIVKNKAILNRKFLFAFALIVLIGFIFWTLLEESPDAFRKEIDIKGMLMLGCTSLLIAVTLYLSFKRLSRVISNYTIKINGDLYINGQVVAFLSNGEKAHVVIQNVGASGGVGGSYTVGMAVGKKFMGLCYELDKVDATKVAEFISSHLNLKIERREAAFFPLFRLH